MTSSGGLGNFTLTYHAANLLIAAGSGHGSPAGDWLGVAAVALGALAVALCAFWFAARARS